MPESAIPPPHLMAGKPRGKPETAVKPLNSTLRALGDHWVIVGPAGNGGREYGLFATRVAGCPDRPRRYLSPRQEESENFRQPLERARAAASTSPFSQLLR